MPQNEYSEVDIIIPVYDEGENICALLESFKRNIKFRYRVLICYDKENDTTLKALANYNLNEIPLLYIKNQGRGVLDAIRMGFECSKASSVITFPADDDYNSERLNQLYQKFKEGYDIVVASRFMPGGYMEGCPWLKAILVRSASLIAYRFLRLPTWDPTNGLRLFSERVIRTFQIESTLGWSFSFELLVKCHRKGWPITEVPFGWRERKFGRSRFRILLWTPQYLRWMGYAFKTMIRWKPQDLSQKQVEKTT